MDRERERGRERERLHAGGSLSPTPPASGTLSVLFAFSDGLLKRQLRAFSGTRPKEHPLNNTAGSYLRLVNRLLCHSA